MCIRDSSVDMDSAYHSQSQGHEHEQEHEQEQGEEKDEGGDHGNFVYQHDEDEDGCSEEDGVQDLRDMAAASASMTAEMKRGEM